MLQLAQNGRVSKGQSTMMKREKSGLVRRNSAGQSVQLDHGVLAAALMAAAGVAALL